jgi:hypothetical protein
MRTARFAAIDTTPVDLRAAAAIEAAEARAWADLYAAAPADFAADAGVGSREVGGALVLRWAASGRRYFSRTIGLGVVEPATPEAIDEIVAGFEQAGITMFLLQSLPHCQPAEYDGWLRERGLEPFDTQDRVVRDGGALRATPSGAGDRELPIEPVTAETADEWAEFLQRVYHLDTGAWLQQLPGRPGWHQYIAREDGHVVAARAMYIGPDRTAWLGMDGPVPGITTDDHEPDAAICARIVQDGLALGARAFIADIEVPSATLDTPAYDAFAALGFRRPYARTHHARVS